MTIFLPQSRMVARKSRSVSVNGRSAEVMKRTRSDRGTNSVVSRSCSRMIAFVPGVSTMWMSRSSSTGAVTTLQTVWTGPAGHGVAVLQHLDLRGGRRHPFLQQHLSEESVDEGALARVELADDHQEEQLVELAHRRGQRGLVVVGRAELGQRVAQGREQLACVCKLSFGPGIENAQHA